MIIAELVIPQMFSAYAEDLNYLQNGLHHYQYFCEECDQIFASAWGKITGNMMFYERGSYIICPNCGTQHHRNVVYAKRGELVPNKVRLVVKEYKEVVTLEVSSDTVYFNDYLSLYARKHKEVFRFDLKKQTVTFNAGIGNMTLPSILNKPSLPIELGNPFKLDIFDASILRFFKPNSLANSNQKKDVNRILKVLRETIHRKLEKQLGYKVSSMFVSPGTCNGTFLLPILNIAYRTICPDAPNLPEAYRWSNESINRFWWDMMINNFDYFDNVMMHTRQKKDFVTELIKAHRLPNKPLIRRFLTEEPFAIKLLARSFTLCENYDYATNLYQSLLNYPRSSYGEFLVNEELFCFLGKMKTIYGPEGILRLVVDAQELITNDCVRLYNFLNDENKTAIETEGVRLKDLHNWMSLRHKLQNHKNLKYDIPDYIIKRLSMQTNRLKFFLPKESIELLAAGHELHNCVASYGSAVKDNSKWIVLVADDQGKLAACLEIKDKALVQAKLDRNRPVRSNAELNAEILTWAKNAKIKIKTPDISIPAKKKTKITIPA